MRLIQGRFRADPCKNLLAVSIRWWSSSWVLRLRALLLWGLYSGDTVNIVLG